MKIKELIQILQSAPDQEREVFINYPVMPDQEERQKSYEGEWGELQFECINGDFSGLGDLYLREGGEEMEIPRIEIIVRGGVVQEVKGLQEGEYEIIDYDDEGEELEKEKKVQNFNL